MNAPEDRLGSKLGHGSDVRCKTAFPAKAEVHSRSCYVAQGRVEDGRGSLGHSATPRFPSPLIKPGVPIFRHPAFRPASSRGTRGVIQLRAVFAQRMTPFALRHSNLGRFRSSTVLPGLSPITSTSPSSEAHRKSGPFAPPALPGLNARTTLSEFAPSGRTARNGLVH